MWPARHWGTGRRECLLANRNWLWGSQESGYGADTPGPSHRLTCSPAHMLTGPGGPTSARECLTVPTGQRARRPTGQSANGPYNVVSLPGTLLHPQSSSTGSYGPKRQRAKVPQASFAKWFPFFFCHCRCRRLDWGFCSARRWGPPPRRLTVGPMQGVRLCGSMSCVNGGECGTAERSCRARLSGLFAGKSSGLP